MKYLLICVFALLITGALVGGANQVRKSSNQDTSVTPTRLPSISSTIKALEIDNAYIEDGELNIVVRNKAKKGIQALTVSSGNFGETLDYGLLTDDPKTLIEPNASFTIDIPAANLKTTIPVVISGVIYDDNTEDGSADVVNDIRKMRQREKVKRLSKANEKVMNQWKYSLYPHGIFWLFVFLLSSRQPKPKRAAVLASLLVRKVIPKSEDVWQHLNRIAETARG